MKIAFYSLNILAIIITFLSGFSSISVGLLSFTVSPYIINIYLLNISKHQTAVVTARVVSLFIVSVGLYFLLDTTYMERNLGYKFSFLFIPLWQLTMLLVSGFVIYLSNGNSKKELL